MKKSLSIISLLVFMIFTSCKPTTSSAPKDTDYEHAEGMIWNTAYHITYKGPASLKDSILIELEKLSNTFNVFDDSSLISQVNRTDSTPVNSDFIRVYSMATKIHRMTGGAFDPTIGPIIRAWGFGKGHTPTSDTLMIDSLLLFCGLDKTRISHDALLKDDIRTEFNFSAIAKGYACDKIVEVMKKNGVKNCLVEIGGEIAAIGNGPSGKDWTISIDRPIMEPSGDNHQSQAIISFTNMGIATSGNYRNYHKNGDSVNGHTISPLTGRPIQTDILSATVLAQSSMMADALATAFMVVGSDESLKININLKLPIMLVLQDSTVIMSSQFEKLIVKN